jgi:hypothetical protein
MTGPKPTAHAASDVPERPVIGWVQVLVYAREPGQSEVRISWPDDALDESAAGAARRQKFLRLVSSELESATG